MGNSSLTGLLYFIGVALIVRTFWCAFRWPVQRETPKNWKKNKIIVGLLITPAAILGPVYSRLNSIFGEADLGVLIFLAISFVVGMSMDAFTAPVIWKKTLS